MGIFRTMNTAASGLTAQRLRLDVISDNISNAETTRTPEGGPYRRSRVIMRPRVDQPYWRGPFIPKRLDNGVGEGVRVAAIEKDISTKPRMVYEPTHPDAIKSGEWEGYVDYGNVNILNEMVDMIAASRSYEANLTVIQGFTEMFGRSLNILGGR
ncbi:MAG: flagellar basal body rod protein FlgC [Spirochaetales bacterium]|jgi:flagellar basal-body rod protein FlgC|nr:flagellar basal body rod protein FlgC [Spirochaetales bacterium]